MEFINMIVKYVQDNWLAMGAALLAFDNLLFAISPLTPWKWDDTLALKLRDIIKKVFRLG